MRKVREREPPTFPAWQTGRVMAPSAYTENGGQERTGKDGRRGGWKEKEKNLSSFINMRYLQDISAGTWIIVEAWDIRT